MKKLLFIVFALLSLMFVSCSNSDDIDTDEENNSITPSSAGKTALNDMIYYRTEINFGHVRSFNPSNSIDEEVFVNFEKSDIDSLVIVDTGGPGTWSINNVTLVHTQTEEVVWDNAAIYTIVDFEIYLKTGEVYTRRFKVLYQTSPVNVSYN